MIMTDNDDERERIANSLSEEDLKELRELSKKLSDLEKKAQKAFSAGSDQETDSLFKKMKEVTAEMQKLLRKD